MRKPNFEHYWGKGKTPSLQIAILKSIVLYGKLSIKSASGILNSNDSDVYDAIQLLKRRNFIEYSDSDTSSTNPQRFYKITEEGLKSLLVVNGLSPDEFWKVITLLCIIGKSQMSQSQLEDYYSQFEKDLLGFSASSHFSQSWLFDKIVQEWMQDNDTNDSSSVSIAQAVIECLALHRTLTARQLVKETSLKEKNIIKVLDKYSVPLGSYRKKRSTDSVSQFLIIAKETNTETTYELSLFGVMLAIAFIRYNHLAVDSRDKRNDKNSKFKLFYKNKRMEEYYDKIAYNHEEKLPNIFNKWSLLKSQLGSLLYDSLDFLIYMKARSNIANKSIWFGGNREFYEDVQNIAKNAYLKLLLVHIQGKGILQYYQDHQYQYKLVPVNNKLLELDKELFYTSQSYFDNKSQQLDSSIDYVNGLEDLFKDEVTFFYYLNLNSLTFSASIDYLSPTPGQVFNIHCSSELFELGSPRQRLMAILTRDKDIKQWFWERLDNIIDYREQISKKMVGFCNEVINSQENTKRETGIQQSNKKPKPEPQRYEYNIARICSEIQSPYDY